MNKKTNESIGQGRGYSGLARVLAVLALLLTAATGAWATAYTTLAVGDVIKVGDTFTPTADGAFNDFGVYGGKTYTLMRADVDNDNNVTEKTDGAYYVFKSYSSELNWTQYINFEKAFAVTAISDGLEVTNIETIKGGTLIYTLALHESAAPVAVTGVTLPSTSSVTLGDAVALTAAVAPADATDKKVKWSITSGSDKVKLYKDADCKTEVGTDVTDVLTVYAKGLAVGDATVKVESNADATKSATCTVTAKHGTYAVAMKDGVKDGDKWTAKAGQDGQYQAMPLKGVEGGTKPVELKYAGDREVKRVTMRVVPAWKGDLSKISATELESDGVTVLVKDGMTLTGTLSENYKIVIADGATVTLEGVTIDGTNDNNYAWAGITCLGDATIILADGTVNTVKGFYEEFPGIYVPDSKALEIKGGLAGTGKLTASSNGNAAGIGGGKALACGSIIIVGGTVTATGGGKAAGIGGGEAAACGSITIADGVTKVIAMKGADAPNNIGAGFDGYCGAVNIGGTVYYDGSDYQNDGATYLTGAMTQYPAGGTINLTNVGPSDLQSDGKTLLLEYGATLTGTLAGNYKIVIPAGAIVTLDGVTINGVNDSDYEWAGITCEGDATIILSGTNTVKGFFEDYPGIQAATGKTLIINGTGSLTASSYGYGAGIGSKMKVACGNIEIQGGTITATSGNSCAGIGGGDRADCGNITISGGTVNAIGGEYGAGIGGGYDASWGNITISGGTVTATGGWRGAGIGGGTRGTRNVSCGNILISGGTVTATGGEGAAGIGGGRGNNNSTFSSCGTITITTGVTKVTATKGDGADNSIGAGKYCNCGTVTIGGNVYYDGSDYQNDGATYLATSPLIYDPAAKPAATVTTAPTGAAVVGVGKTTGLVSGGAADGGTLMYAVTTTNTKPTSTAGFSASVPTAQTITASGKVYVWYYVKADDTHSDSEIAATAIEVPVADIVWDGTNVSDLQVAGDYLSYEKEGVTLSGNAQDIYAWWDNDIRFIPSEPGGFTFTAPTGKAFTRIEMKAISSLGWAAEYLGTGWAFALDMSNTPTVTWTGSAASTVGLLTDADDFTGSDVKSIAFYLSE